MASIPVIAGIVVMFVLFAILTAGLSTPHWYHFKDGDMEVFRAGLFKICLTGPGNGQEMVCSKYADFETLITDDYYAVVILEVLAVLLFLIGFIVGIIDTCKQGETVRSTLVRLSSFSVAAATCSIGGIIWFIISFYSDDARFDKIVSSTASKSLGYSFYVSAVFTVLGFAFGITMSIIGHKMKPQVMTNNKPQPAVTPVAMVMEPQDQLPDVPEW